MGPQGQGHREVGLAHAGRSQQQQVDGPGDEGQVGQLLDLAFVDGRLEGESELFQGALEREVGQPRPGAEIALPSGGDFHP